MSTLEPVSGQVDLCFLGKVILGGRDRTAITSVGAECEKYLYEAVSGRILVKQRIDPPPPKWSEISHHHPFERAQTGGFSGWGCAGRQGSYPAAPVRGALARRGGPPAQWPRS
jgi:hypothetical protein